MQPWLVWLSQGCMVWLSSGWSASLQTKWVASSRPSQGTCLGCRPGPQLGAHKWQPHIAISLSIYLPPYPLL